MPTPKKVFSVSAAVLTFVAMGVLAANLNTLEATKHNAHETTKLAQSVTEVTVTWETNFDTKLGESTIVGATLVPSEGTIHSTSTIDVTIAGALGGALGTMSSNDGGVTWSALSVPVAASDAIAATVVINSDEALAAVTAP